MVIFWQRRIVFEAETTLRDDIINACNKTGQELTERTKAQLDACNYFCSLICAYCCTVQPYLQTYTLRSVQKLVPCVIWKCHESTDEVCHLLYHHTALLWEEHTVHPSRNIAGRWYDVDWSLQLEDPVSWAWMCLQKIFQSLITGVHNDLLQWLGFEAFIAVIMNSFWDATLCSLVDRDQYFRRTYLPNQIMSHIYYIGYNF